MLYGSLYLFDGHLYEDGVHAHNNAVKEGTVGKLFKCKIHRFYRS